MTITSSEFVTFDEFIDVKASIQILTHIITDLEKNPYLWKWAIIAAHSALNGACVAILTQTDGSGALDKKSEQELINYHSFGSQKAINENAGAEWILDDPKTPTDKLADFKELLTRLPNDIRITLPKRYEDCLTIELKDFFRLHDFRNRFIHFISTTWSIELAGLPRIIIRTLKHIQKIMNHNDYTRSNCFSEVDRNSVVNLISMLDKLSINCE